MKSEKFDQLQKIFDLIVPPLYGVNLAIENSTDGGKGEGKNHKLPQNVIFSKS